MPGSPLVPTSANIVQLVRAARARWKIENEGFNTLKNQGYHLEHNFGHGHQHLSTLFVLNLLAFFMHQIFELVDGRRKARCAPPSGVHIRCWCA